MESNDGYKNLETFKGVLNNLGGWPLPEDWHDGKFDWIQATYQLRDQGFQFRMLLDVSFDQDLGRIKVRRCAEKKAGHLR